MGRRKTQIEVYLEAKIKELWNQENFYTSEISKLETARNQTQEIRLKLQQDLSKLRTK